ncbi:MAG: hypothetical protein ABEH35_07000 [Haloarculaceae archaeon]
MSTNATDPTNEVTPDERGSQYAELNVGDDKFVIYDRENHQAWVQSTVTVDVDSIR